MDFGHVPEALRARLGELATIELVSFVQQTSREWSDDVLNVSVERLERRLASELSVVRVEMERGFAVLRQEVGNARVELIRWSFLFWIGQVAAMFGILALVARATGRF